MEFTKLNLSLREKLVMFGFSKEDTNCCEACKYTYKTYLPEHLLIKFYKQEFKQLLTKSKLKTLVKDKLIEVYVDKGGNRYPLNTLWRVQFIEQFRNKFSYALPILQQVIAYEDKEILRLMTDEFYEKTFNPIKWGTKALKDIHESGLKEAMEEGDIGDGYLNFMKQMVKKVNRIPKKKEWKKLNNEEKKLIEDEVRVERGREEHSIYKFITDYHNLILKGFSPQIALKKSGITWEKTIKRINENDFIDYFSTPDFIVEFNKSDININIANPKYVKSAEFRRIGRIYGVFLKRIGSKRKAWGENSGIRLQLMERDNYLRTFYKKLRKEKKDLSSMEIIDEYLIPYCSKVRMSVSVERMKKIIYSRN